LINTGYACFTSCSLNYFVYAFDISNNSTNEFIPGTYLYCNNCNFYYDFNYYYDCNFRYFSIDVKRVYFSCHTTMHAMLMLYNAMLNYRINVSFDLLIFLEESSRPSSFFSLNPTLETRGDESNVFRCRWWLDRKNLANTILFYAILCYACYVILYFAMIAIICYTALCYTMLYYTALSYTTLLFTILWYAILFYAMICYAILCYDML